MKARAYYPSTVDIKRIYPQATNEPYACLSFDKNEGEHGCLILWVGKAEDHCEGIWEMHTRQARQIRFEIPRIPYKFVLVSGTIYYRLNVE